MQHHTKQSEIKVVTCGITPSVFKVSRTNPQSAMSTTTGRLSRAKNIFLQWSHHSDINGYAKIFMYQSHGLVQFLWLVILTCSTCATYWLISKSVLDFLSYEVVSQIDVYYEMPAPFPAITICDNDPFTSAQAEKLYDSVLKANLFGLNWYSPNVVSQDLNFLVKMHAAHPAYGDQMRRALGFDKKLVLSCKYNQLKCGEDLRWYYSFEYGNCWQFNARLTPTSLVKEALLEDKDMGFAMTVFPLVSHNRFMTTWDQGMIVFVHNNSFRPVSADGIYIKPGEMSLISVKREMTQKYPFPYSECIDLASYSSELFDFMIRSNKTYRQGF